MEPGHNPSSFPPRLVGKRNGSIVGVSVEKGITVVHQTHPDQASSTTPDAVATIEWPVQAAWRDDRAARGEPSILLIAVGSPVPETDPFLEDWALITASAAELEARQAALWLRVQERREMHDRQTTPVLVDNVLRLGDRSLVLAPIEVRLLRALLNSQGTILTRDALVRATWPDGEPKSNTLSVRLTHLRKRLKPLRISILTFRKHGFMLELPTTP
jgi:hypothetical protein